jgi:hypothetical protein
MYADIYTSVGLLIGVVEANLRYFVSYSKKSRTFSVLNLYSRLSRGRKTGKVMLESDS